MFVVQAPAIYGRTGVRGPARPITPAFGLWWPSVALFHERPVPLLPDFLIAPREGRLMALASRDPRPHWHSQTEHQSSTCHAVVITLIALLHRPPSCLRPRTGSVEVERMRGSNTPEYTAGDPGEIGAGRRARELSYTREAGAATLCAFWWSPIARGW